MSGIATHSQFIAGNHAPISVGAVTVVTLGATAGVVKKQLNAAPVEFSQATAVYITVEGGQCYYTLDGTAPTANGSAGHLRNINDEIVVEGWQNIKQFKVIAATGASVVLKVTSFFNSTGGWAG